MNAASGSDEPQKIWDAHTMNAPWGLAKRLTTAVQAVQFFNPNRYAESCKLIDKNPDQQQALSLLEFVKYLEKTEALGDRKPNLLRVAEVLNAMSREGILQNVGSYAGKPNFFHDCFLFMYAGSQNRNRVMGQLWLAAALGPEFIYYAIGHGVVQITGKHNEGDDAAGTGRILSEHTILTARHVVTDMKVDEIQEFQDVKCIVKKEQIKFHNFQDVAIITVEQSLKQVNGLVLHSPRVGQQIHVLGFPLLPFVSSPALVMHTGEVTNHSVDLINGEKAFLYSAITRPGNSGGPIVSYDGYLVGIATKDIPVEKKGSTLSPHYAGVDAATIGNALADLGLDMRASFERLE